MTDRFSDRMGVTKLPILRLATANDEIKAAIWNAMIRTLGGLHRTDETSWNEISQQVAMHVLKQPADSIPRRTNDVEADARSWLKTSVMYPKNWWEPFNILEATGRQIVAGFPDYPTFFDEFAETATLLLRDAGSGYGFVAGHLAPIVAPEEVAAITQAIEHTRRCALSGPSRHLDDAVAAISAKPMPNNRNVIKEAISAVESLARALTGKKASLKDALDVLNSRIAIHGALKAGFEKLYGWTSDAEGIRHGLMDEPSLDFEDSLFMLVSCSAFTNYLLAKAEKAGLVQQQNA